MVDKSNILLHTVIKSNREPTKGDDMTEFTEELQSDFHTMCQAAQVVGKLDMIRNSIPEMQGHMNGTDAILLDEIMCEYELGNHA